uniref:EF-hand domain-containing protein n=1 Tax=Zooxanthella nutricula TaxID=1333877 RepID=A0A7S2QCU8_9DINO
MPLCTVIGGNVFVVHAGLSSVRPTTLERIRQIRHTTCTMPAEPADALDTLWVDLLWSDPQDERGLQESSRGAGVEFGPDVTSAFFKDNPGIKLIIRSHNVPEQGGYQRHHYNRVITLFSASNYCGDYGNKGAVLVFDGLTFPSYEAYEYYAPPLELVAGLVAQEKTVQDWLALGEKLYTAGQEELEETIWAKEVQRLTVILVESKPDLLKQLRKVTGGKYEVDFVTWQYIMTAVLGSAWNFRKAWDHWELGRKTGGVVNFVDFLSRFTVCLRNEAYMSFKYKAIFTAFNHLMSLETSLEDTASMFDTDGDGQVTVEELCSAMRKLNADMTEAQLESLIHVFFRGQTAGGVLTLAPHECLSRFVSLMKCAQETSGCGSVQRSAAPALRQMREVFNAIGQAIARTPADTPMTPTADRFHALFDELDEDDSGFIEIEEMVSGLWKLPGIQELELANQEKLTKEKLSEIAQAIDHNGSGTVSLMEFLFALQVDDIADTAVDVLADNILSVLLRHRSSVAAVSHLYDKEVSGTVSMNDFRKVLEALNACIEETMHNWSQSQIDCLCEAFNTGGRIEYSMVFDSFEVVDGLRPEQAVSMKGRNSVVYSPISPPVLEGG